MKEISLSNDVTKLLDSLVFAYGFYNILRWPDADVNMDYRSPVHDFEMALQKAGVKPPLKMFYEYNVPGGGKIDQRYLRRVWRLQFMMRIDAEYVKDIDSFFDDLVAQLYSIYGEELGAIKEVQFFDAVKKIDAPTEQAIQDLINVLPQLQSDTYNEIVSEVESLKRINPELQHINVDINNVSSVLEFLEDVALGWAPEEIDYFLHQKIERPAPCYDYLYGIGMYEVCTMRPDRMEKIVTAVKQKLE